ncbi:MAG: hypothetical protein LBR58_01610 [Propionibacteriaceae bacterium]|nr:hypothetical protein [Propionibacteriaceae bacterium]
MSEHRPNIDDYAPPRLGLGWIIAIIVAVVGLVGGLYLLTRPAEPPAKASPSPTYTRAKPPFGISYSNERGRETGHWEITDQRWTYVGLQLTVHIAADKGDQYLQLEAWRNHDLQSFSPNQSPPYYEHGWLKLDEGEEVTFTLVFADMEPCEATLMLRNEDGEQLSGWEITQ